MRADVATKRLKLVVVGDGMVGKTCLLHAFSKGKFVDGYIPTVFETYVADIEVKGRPIELTLWDTAGQEDYNRLRPISYPDTDVVLMLYSVDNPDSLANVASKWIPEIRHFCPNVPYILAAAKKDLRPNCGRNTPVIEKKLEPGLVSESEGQALAALISARAFLETSAKTMENVQEVFEVAARVALKKNRCSRWSRRTCHLL